MTDAELQAIRERCEKATRGPWQMLDGASAIIAFCSESPTKKSIICLCSSGFANNTVSGVFIAAARADVPALLDEVERLRVEGFRLAQAIVGEAAQPKRSCCFCGCDPAYAGHATDCLAVLVCRRGKG